MFLGAEVDAQVRVDVGRVAAWFAAPRTRQVVLLLLIVLLSVFIDWGELWWRRKEAKLGKYIPSVSSRGNRA